MSNGDRFLDTEHWIDDEEVTASMCSHVCRVLGIREEDIRFESENGDQVRVSSPAEPLPN